MLHPGTILEGFWVFEVCHVRIHDTSWVGCYSGYETARGTRCAVYETKWNKVRIVFCSFYACATIIFVFCFMPSLAPVASLYVHLTFSVCRLYCVSCFLMNIRDFAASDTLFCLRYIYIFVCVWLGQVSLSVECSTSSCSDMERSRPVLPPLICFWRTYQRW